MRGAEREFGTTPRARCSRPGCARSGTTAPQQLQPPSGLFAEGTELWEFAQARAVSRAKAAVDGERARRTIVEQFVETRGRAPTDRETAQFLALYADTVWRAELLAREQVRCRVRTFCFGEAEQEAEALLQERERQEAAEQQGSDEEAVAQAAREEQALEDQLERAAKDRLLEALDPFNVHIF